MKRIFTFLATMTFALVAYAPMDAQPCLFLEHPHNLDSNDQGWSNPDSVLVDTCCNSQIHEECLYANRYFEVQMDYDMYPFNHVLDSGEVRPASEIIPALQSFKDGVLALEGQLGNIYFKGLETHTDTNSLKENPLLYVYFERYQNINDVKATFSALPNVKRYLYINQYRYLLGGVNEPNGKSDVYPNPVRNVLHLDFLKVGEAYQIYDSNGKLLLSGTVQADRLLELSNLKSGMFIIKSASSTNKFIKE